MEDRPLRDDEYPDDPGEQPPRQPQELDAISQAVGSGAYVYRYQLQECVERFAGTVARYPETFDRYYFAAEGGPLLVDILLGDQDQRPAQEASKHVEFKRAWCAEHDRRYLVLSEDDADDIARVRALLAQRDQPVGEDPGPRVSRPASSGQRKRGAIQRPKAAA
jgi:hypothetical protein